MKTAIIFVVSLLCFMPYGLAYVVGFIGSLVWWGFVDAWQLVDSKR